MEKPQHFCLGGYAQGHAEDCPHCPEGVVRQTVERWAPVLDTREASFIVRGATIPADLQYDSVMPPLHGFAVMGGDGKVTLVPHDGIRPQPRVRLHVSVGKRSGGLYWWFTMADDPNPYSVLNQRHVTVNAAWQQFATRMKLGLV